jgi:hypothetical protein
MVRWAPNGNRVSILAVGEDIAPSLRPCPDGQSQHRVADVCPELLDPEAGNGNINPEGATSEPDLVRSCPTNY